MSSPTFPDPRGAEEGSTLVVGPGARVTVSATGNLIVTLPEAAPPP